MYRVIPPLRRLTSSVVSETHGDGHSTMFTFDLALEILE